MISAAQVINPPKAIRPVLVGSAFLLTLLIVLLAMGRGSAGATELVYEFKNPAFGGNPSTGIYLLQAAQAQNDHKAPDGDEDSELDDFEESLRRRLLGIISQRIATQLLGEDGLQEGTYEFGDFTIIVEDVGDGMKITITDHVTGESTEIFVPFF